jgi:hypothetical protein
MTPLSGLAADFDTVPTVRIYTNKVT